MDNFEKNLQYPSPLSVCFHCWEDQCCPLLRFSCFASVSWNNFRMSKSSIWSDPGISSVLFGGTDSGTIVAYKIYVSKETNKPSMKPISLLFGHKSSITSIAICDKFIYRSCVASLSTDGTLSLISVEDLTIVYNSEFLFSENSYDLAPHESNRMLMLASQDYGTVEIADLTNSTLILRISGFPSIITSIECNHFLHSVACADGSIAVFQIDKSVECYYNLKINIDNGQSNNFNFYRAVLSPSLMYMLVLTSEEWYLFDSDDALFSQKISSPEDSFVIAKWVNDSMFYITTIAGRVEVWKVDQSNSTQIFNRMRTNHSFYYISSLSEKKRIEPTIMIDAPSDTRKLHKPPELVYSIDHSQNNTLDTATIVTAEGFVITSPRDSFLVLNSPQGDCDCDLSMYFTSKIRCRCALGDPIVHEARITVEGEVFLDSQKLGVHPGANLLFSSPNGNTFFSFSNDGSVKAWGDKLLASFHDLCEPVREVTYIEEKEWIIVIGQLSAFSVISISQLQSIILCSGHNSPVVEVLYLNGLLHSRCESSSIYTWNIDGQLVSKRKSKKIKRIGETAASDLGNNTTAPSSSRSDSSLHDKSTPAKRKRKEKSMFSKIVPLIMPNCQTFAIVLDIFDFLEAYKCYETLNIQNDPIFFSLIILWRCHIGSSRIKVAGDIGLLESFNYAIGGDNYTVSLPFSLQSQKEIEKSTEKTTNVIAFKFSPLLSAIHSVAASATAACFVGVNNDENLALVSSVSQITTANQLPDSVTPSPLVIANYLLFPSPFLRSIVINLIQEIMSHLSESESNVIIYNVENYFTTWKAILPFVFIHCTKYKLNKNFGKKCAQSIFPVVIEIPEILDLMLNCFEQFSVYFDDYQSFFISMVDATISKKISYNKIAGFGIVKPIDFFDVGVMTPYCPELCEALFDRWMNPNRDILLTLITHILASSRKGISIDLDRIFDIIDKKISYFAACKNYLVFGSETGEIIVFSRETTLINWKQQITKHPISCLSVSPNGSRFVVVVLENEYSFSWISPNSGHSREAFSIDAIEILPRGTVVSDFVWKAEGKVILMNMDKKIMEFSAPNMSFFQRLKKK